ncbi:MAG: EthD family reductase [Terricaulis sp.]
MQDRRDFILGAGTSVGAMTLASCATTNAAAEAPVSFNVIYPNHEGARFDTAYYKDTHIPLVMRVMNAASVTLTEGVPMGATPAPFAMIAHFQFASAEALDAALANPAMAELRAMSHASPTSDRRS